MARTELRFYSKCNQEVLEGFNPESDMLWSKFSKANTCCSLESTCEGPSGNRKCGVSRGGSDDGSRDGEVRTC